jgi:hypothetical protein
VIIFFLSRALLGGRAGTKTTSQAGESGRPSGKVIEFSLPSPR